MSRPRSTHHHGPLAGIGAGAAAVLTGGVLILIAARRQLGEVATVIAWALMAAVVGAVLAAAVYVFLWLQYRIRHPEALAGRQVTRAEVVDEAPAPQAIEAAQPPAIEPARVYLNVSPDQLAAIMQHHTED
jgi:uncharacterized membrane protein YccC